MSGEGKYRCTPAGLEASAWPNTSPLREVIGGTQELATTVRTLLGVVEAMAERQATLEAKVDALIAGLFRKGSL